jgi:YHS domain-containing protein
MIIRFILFLVLFYLLYRVIKYFQKTKSIKVDDYKYKTAQVEGEDLVEDPLCHTYISVSQAHKKEITGKEYYFCSKECCEIYISQKTKERQQGEV